MNTKLISLSVLLGMFAFLPNSIAQCEIKNLIYPDGSMMYYIEPVNFYYTSSKSLRGGISTDKENYYLELLPVPFPEKPAGNKLKENLDMRLSDGNWYSLQHYDTRYSRKDTALKMIFLIDKEFMDQFLKLDVTDVKIDMMDSAGIRAYVFKLHKSALRDQLECFLSEEEKTKEK